MIGSIEENISKVKAYLKTQCMNVNMDWLTGCVEFFCEENKNRSINDQELNNMVKSQWMLGDLKDLCPGSLPPDLNKVIKSTLNDVYVLQMNAVFDIGTPAYQQLQKLNRIDQTNIEATNNQSCEPSPLRMLKLILTDGIQEISGIEYKSMRNLSSDLTPGIKMKIKGPVDCRRGVLMLEEKHILILGGEVEDFLETNCPKNILSRRIGIDETTLITDFTRDSYRPPVTQNNFIDALESSHNKQPKQNSSIHDGKILSEIFVDEYIDINEIDAIEREVNKNHIEPTCGYVTPQNAAKKMKVSTLPSQTNSQILHCLPHLPDVTDGTSNNDDFEQYYNEEMENIDYNDCRAEFENARMSPSSRLHEIKRAESSQNPYVYIKQLSQATDIFCSNKTFIVKAQILKQLSKLSLQKCSWVFKCTIIDGSGMLDVSISSNVLTEIIGYSPEEVNAMKKQFNTNPTLKEKFLEGIDKAERKLRSLDSILHVTFQPSGPCIVKITQFTDHHLFQLKQRIQTGL